MQTHVHSRTRQVTLPSHQAGVMLLEALIAVVIFSLGILGLVALQARSLSLEQDSNYRAQAAMLANQMISQVWAGNERTACTDFDEATTVVTNWKTQVMQTLPGVDNSMISYKCTPNSVTRSGVIEYINQIDITIQWKLPSSKELHSFSTTA